MPKYRRVDMIDRCDIDRLKSEGRSQSEIARMLGFHRSTISRELRRNKAYVKRWARPDLHYNYGAAQEAADECLSYRRLARKLKSEALRYTLSKLELFWSPEQISKRMRKDLGYCVCHETIYRFLRKDKIEGGRLFTLLRRGRRKRKSHFPSLKRIPKKMLLPSIEERPTTAESRSEIGHWERDTMFGLSRKKAILVLVDRRTRLIKLAKLSQKTAEQTNKATKELLKGLPIESITNDRGSEFLKHEDLKVPIFYCHPYTSQERGTVENQIGLLRQFIPKGFNLDEINEDQLKLIEEKLNNRPRKTLDWSSPSEVFTKETVAM